MDTTFTTAGSFVVEHCPNCGVAQGVPAGIIREAKKRARSVYCPNGHSWVYNDTAEKERASLKAELAHQKELVEHYRVERDSEARRGAAARGQVTKIKNRVSCGVCPCCNRSFTNLARHMAGQHPDFKESK